MSFAFIVESVGMLTGLTVPDTLYLSYKESVVLHRLWLGRVIDPLTWILCLNVCLLVLLYPKLPLVYNSNVVCVHERWCLHRPDSRMFFEKASVFVGIV